MPEVRKRRKSLSKSLVVAPTVRYRKINDSWPCPKSLPGILLRRVRTKVQAILELQKVQIDVTRVWSWSEWK